MRRDDELMTVGELARRTGLSVKAIRRYEALGLIYSVGRSEGNYRLFDASALWCAQVVSTLRSLGLTIKEIDQLGVPTSAGRTSRSGRVSPRCWTEPSNGSTTGSPSSRPAAARR
jgi:DNA-binding transcriptional MerR regulator